MVRVGVGRIGRAVLVVVLAASFAGVVSVSPAAATQVNWNCGVLPLGSWCLYTFRHTYFYNSAHYDGSGGPVYVCEKTIRDSDGSTYQQSCGLTFVDASFSNCCTLLKPLVQNAVNSDGPHTINGTAAY